jgi:hypothetical protein
MSRDKEKQKIRSRAWYLANKEKCAEKSTIWNKNHKGERAEEHKKRYAKPEVRERMRIANEAYRKTHKKETAIASKEYRETHKEKVAAGQKAYRDSHKKEIALYMKNDYLKNREKHIDRSRKTRYGMSRISFDLLLKEQGGVCAICETAPWLSGKDNRKGPVVDHDHVTGKVRGILCKKCNTALGLVNDRLDMLKAMETYLKKSQKGAVKCG